MSKSKLLKQFPKDFFFKPAKIQLKQSVKYIYTISEAAKLLGISADLFTKKISITLALLVMLPIILYTIRPQTIISNSSVLGTNIVNKQASENQLQPAVLAASIATLSGKLNINLPTSFNQTTSFNEGVDIHGKLTLIQGLAAEGEIVATTLTASNVIYSLTAGNGISVSSGQSPTITNTGVLSLAGKTGALTLTEGTDITIDGLKITNKSTLDTIRGRGGCSSCILDADVVAGLTISGGSVNDSPIGASTASTGAFTTLTASSTLGITGATTLASTLAVTGATTLNGNITFTGGAASNIIPATDSIYDLGSVTKQWGTVYASNLSVSGVNSAGQLISTYVPTGSTISTGPLYINPTTATAGYTLAGFAVGGSAKFRVTSNGTLLSGADGSADLGSADNRWNNLYVNTLTASGTNYQGQASFTYEPTSSAIGQGSIWINPTTATAAYPLLSVSVGGTEKARITSDGYLGLGGANDPGSTYFINAGANFNVTTAGAATFGSTLGVTGISTFTGNANANGGIDVDDAFVVADGGALTTSQTATFNGALDANGQFDLGDGGDAGTISATTLDIDATGALQINSSGGAISIGNDAVAQAINIGTGAAARTITLGNATGATALAFTSGTGSQTFTSSVVSTTGTSSAFVFNDAVLTTGTLMYLQAAAVTTGNLLDINTGSSIFSISNTALTTSLPTNFTSSGDVGIAYDINFTNPTASYIKSLAPINITAGETFNSTNLTLQTYNQGTVVVDTAATTGTSMNLLANGVTTGTGLLINANALTTGNAVSLSSTSTAGGASGASYLLNLARSGTNTGATHTAYGIASAVTNTGTTSVNVGGLFTATGATTNRGLEVAAMTGATSTGLTIGALSGTTADTGISIGAISGAAATGTGITIGNISTTGATNRGITLGTLTGGTGTNYQINTGILTSATTTTNAQLNLGGIVTTGGTTNYGINVGALSGTGTTNYGINITASTATGTTNYGMSIGALSGAATTNYGLNIGNLSGATTSNGIVVGTLSSATSTGLTIGALSGTTANTGINIGAISGALGTGTGITIGNISTTGVTNYGLQLGTMTGGTTSNYQISVGNITAVASATNIGISLGTIGGTAASSTNYILSSGAISSTGTINAQLNLGAVSGAAATNYGINIGNISGATANSYGINIGTIGGVGTASYGVNIGANSATATTNYGIQTGAISGAGTNNYGLYIGAVSGAVTENFALFTAGGKVQFTCTTNNLAAATDPNCSDYAEIYNTDDSLEPGDIVTLDTSKSKKVTLSSTSYQKQIIGIYSTSPGMLIGADGITSAAGEEAVKNLPAGKVPVALTGRVPVKVSLENGPIEVGNYLTSSSTPGVAMKATKPGQVIGKAMENFDSTTCQGDNTCQGKILTFVNVTFADPNDVLANLTLDANGNLISNVIASDEGAWQSSTSNNNPSLEDSSTALGMTTLKDQLASMSARLANLESVITRNEVTKQSSTSSASISSEDSSLISQNDTLNLTPPDTLLATGSATLADLKVTSQATFSGMLASYDLTVQNTFKSLGQAVLGATTIAGDLSVDGTLSISHNSLNSLTTLYIQNSPLAEKLDIFNGKVQINKEGNIITAGSITTNKVIVSNQSAGKAKLFAGSTTVDVNSSNVTSKSLIFITPTTLTDKVLVVTSKIVGQKFIVGTSSAPSGDIEFNWWIVDSE